MHESAEQGPFNQANEKGRGGGVPELEEAMQA